MRLFLVALLILVTELACRAQLAAGVAEPLPTLTEAQQVRALSPEQANRALPARIKGVVTLFDTEMSLCFVQDATAGIYVYQSPQHLKKGQIVEVTGVTNPGRFSPIIIASALKVLGEGELPVPKPLSMESLATGSDDSQWVEITGLVRAQTIHAGNLVLELAYGLSVLKVRVINFGGNLAQVPQFEDAIVRARGVLGIHHNTKGQLTGFHLLTPSLEELSMLKAGVADAFSLPVTPIRSLLSFTVRNNSGNRVHVRGTVLFNKPGERMFIRDTTGGVEVWSHQTSDALPGDEVAVAGFPLRGGFTPGLKNSTVRVLSSGKPPEPKRISATQAAGGDYDVELVQLEAFLVQIDPTDERYWVLYMRSSTEVFKCYLPRKADDDDAPDLAPGSLLRVNGVCTVTLDENRKPQAFDLWMRDPRDVMVMLAPSWWTADRVRWVAGGCLGVVVLGFGWVHLLRRKVRERTLAIEKREATLEERYRELFENANDIIYSVDLTGRFTSLNRAGQKVLGYSLEEALKLTVQNIVPEDQLSKVSRELSRKVEAGERTSYELEMLDRNGRRRCMEVNSRLLYAEGKPVGIQGIARDITERKLSESVLREREQQLRRSIEERERIGRDLHDGIIQSIYAIGLGLDQCKRVMAEDTQRASTELNKSIEDLNRVIRDVRSFIVGLEPEMLRGQEFRAALKSLVLMMNQSQSGRFSLQVDPLVADQLNSQQATNLLHIAREAMSNSLRHAHARTTTVLLQRQNGHIHFEVADDGEGFDLPGVKQSGHGLRNITSRAVDLGAELQIQTTPGCGTRVVLKLPPQTNAYGLS